MQKRVYLNVLFEEKDEAKAYGAKWDKDEKKWYTLSNNEHYAYLTDKFHKHRFHLNCKILEQQRAKEREKQKEEYITVKPKTKKYDYEMVVDDDEI